MVNSLPDESTVATTSDSGITYSPAPKNDPKLRESHAAIQEHLQGLSKEATFFRQEIKNAKTSAKKNYYQKKLQKSTTNIIRILTRLQVGM
jgi:hypothetical protein